MHPFVPPVLLWLSGLDTLVIDADLNPPHVQLREAAERLGGEGISIISADCIWEAPALGTAAQRPETLLPALPTAAPRRREESACERL